MDSKSKIIIIDQGYLMHRCIFAFSAHPDCSATFMFMNMAISYLKKFEVTLEDRIFLAFDYGRSWRKIVDPTYKAQRKVAREQQESPEWWKEMYSEFNQFFDKLEPNINWNFMKMNSREADDWISVICRYYKENPCIVVSSDRDLEQLCLFPNVQIFSPLTKKFKEVKYPMKILLEKINGDKSDNLLVKPSNEMEFEIRKKIVDLTKLPPEIENPMFELLVNSFPKNLYINKIPYNSLRSRLKILYKI